VASQRPALKRWGGLEVHKEILIVTRLIAPAKKTATIFTAKKLTSISAFG
jgi:hypothetical protein